MTSDTIKLQRLIKAVRRFNQFDTKMQVSTVLTLLEIAAAEGQKRDISVKDIETRVGLKSGTSTRNVMYWEKGHKEMTGGHEMVRVDFDPIDRRKRSLSMTAKGKAFVSQLIEGFKDDGET